MTIAEMHIEFEVFLDKIDSESYPEISPEEKDLFLNEAQERFIKTRYNPNNNYRTGFEQSQKRTEDLKNLVKTGFCDPVVSSAYQALGLSIYEINLSTIYVDKDRTVDSLFKYFIFLKGIPEITEGTCKQYFSIERVLQQDDFTTVLVDPFNKVKTSKPFMFFENNNIYIWTSNTASVTNFLLTFLKRPALMNLGTYGGTATNCELSEHTHKEIVQIAVAIALENIESPRQQTQQINLNQSE